jgi:HEPN domain-containing protein
MKPLVDEWVAKADGDFHVMQRESRVRHLPNFDAICFHAQQCAEKYLKARLCAADARIPKIHDLTELLELVASLEPNWERFRNDLSDLTDFAVTFRYPQVSADRGMAAGAAESCRRFCLAARRALIPRKSKAQSKKKA